MTAPSTITISDDQRRELVLVLPSDAAPTDLGLRALVDGREASVDQAIARIGELINASVAPVIRGAHHLTLEALRKLVPFARRSRSRWVIAGGDRLAGAHPVAHTATLDAAMSADLLIWLRPADTERSPITNRLRSRRRDTVTLDGDIDAALELHAALRAKKEGHSTVAAICSASHVTVVASSNIDTHALALWHRLAADQQRTTRIEVLQLPSTDDANARGVREMLTWATGVAPSHGAADFAVDPPVPASSHGPCDLLMDFNPSEKHAPPDTPRIVIGGASSHDGPRTTPAAHTVRIITPGLAVGLAARVMRFDGAILWLCDESSHAPPDPVIDLINRLTDTINTQS